MCTFRAFLILSFSKKGGQLSEFPFKIIMSTEILILNFVFSILDLTQKTRNKVRVSDLLMTNMKKLIMKRLKTTKCWTKQSVHKKLVSKIAQLVIIRLTKSWTHQIPLTSKKWIPLKLSQFNQRKLVKISSSSRIKINYCGKQQRRQPKLCLKSQTPKNMVSETDP